MIPIIKKVKPVFNGVVTTMNKYPADMKVKGTDLFDAAKSGAIKEYQTVVAVGPAVKGIEVGDTVVINPKRYAVMKHKKGSLQDGVIKDNPVIGYDFNVIEINGEDHLYIFDSDVLYVAEIEEFEENPTIVTEKDKKILLN